MLRVISFLVAFFAFTLFTLASPLPENINGLMPENLEKRITHTGRGTWYEPGLGNCGYTDSSSDNVVAIAKSRYGDGGNCNQWIRITNTANGEAAYALTRDSCQSCGGSDLDMSPAVFSQIADLNTGVIEISWNFMSKSFSP